uniref:Phenylalanine--tRNA ligase beta subunit n=1 Tax=uncultured delta proteobacterium TaxID=34034 RepID=Q2YZU4_9DELT|nr:Phenylalanyl-tRNA synthetase beta subunit [uncultured delta proteobacterium]
MIVSLSWLKQYIDISISPVELSECLTMAGLEVEGMEYPNNFLKDVIVAEVISTCKHINADHLMVCQVDNGAEHVQVVCGAPNVRAGAKYPLALPGATMPNNMTISRSKLRGEVSNGMLCSAKELNIGDNQSGIMELDYSYETGTSILKTMNLNEVIFELSVTPNRPDWLSVTGVAREISALLNIPFKMPEIFVNETGEDIKILTQVTNEAPELCQRYAARVIEGITIKESPKWLKERLKSVGIRSINNVVDITNFVLMELGQPLHAFDFDLLEEQRIVIKKAGNEFLFNTLDGAQHKLDPSSLMICDGNKPVAIAGIMGGENSEIHAGTTRVFLESAYFNPPDIRKISKQTGIRTESSYRFERGVDPDCVVFALNRAACLISELAGGRIAKGVIDCYPEPIQQSVIKLSTSSVNKMLGLKLSSKDIRGYLQALGMYIDTGEDSDILLVTPPNFRQDIKRSVDLIEEVARMHGYDKIPVTFPTTEVIASPQYQHQELREKSHQSMVSLGFMEIINYSFISRDSIANLGLSPDSELIKAVEIKNPLSEDQSIMRTTLIPGILNTMRGNLNHKNLNLSLFEIGKVFIPTSNELPDEREMLIALITGKRTNLSWMGKNDPVDFFDIKGVLETLFEQMSLPSPELKENNNITYLSNSQNAAILINGKAVGEIGMISKKVKAAFDLKQDAFIFQLDLAKLMPFALSIPTFKHIFKFPAVERDIAIVVDEHVKWSEVLFAIKNIRISILEKIELFDIFRDAEKVGQGRKSMAINFLFRSEIKTLNDNEVNKSINKIIQTLSKVINAILRV